MPFSLKIWHLFFWKSIDHSVSQVRINLGPSHNLETAKFGGLATIWHVPQRGSATVKDLHATTSNTVWQRNVENCVQVIAHRRRCHNYPTATACDFKTVQYWLETYYATFTSSLILHSAFVAVRNRKHCSLIMPRQMKTRSYIKPQISKRRIRASVLSSCTYERYDVSRFSSM